MAEAEFPVLPPAARRILQQISDLTPDQFGALDSSLGEVPPNGEWWTTVAEQLDFMEASHLAEIVSFTSDMLRAVLPRIPQVSVKDLASSLATAQAGRQDDELASRLERLMQHPTIKLFQKIQRLKSTPEPRLVSVKTLSDMRPVFHEEDRSSIDGYVIVHTLLLQLQSDGSKSTTLVHLDRADLESVRDEVDEALRKHEQLMKQLSSSALSDYSEVGSDAR